MQFEVLTDDDKRVVKVPGEVGPSAMAPKRRVGAGKRRAVALIYYLCLGLAGLVFALGCFILATCTFVLDLFAFAGLLGVALGSLVWGRVKRTKGYFWRVAPAN